MSRSFKTVDVFSDIPLLGNPVAVILDAEGLDAGRMQAIARWTNLSETTFVLPPETRGANYRLRIFTPLGELPFAGHPTLGSAHAVIEAGICHPTEGLLIQQCGAGLVPVSVESAGDATRLFLHMPSVGHRCLVQDELDELSAVLGSHVRSNPPPELVNVGAVWIVAEMEDVDSLLSLRPDHARCAVFERDIGANGISLYAKGANGIETRSFAASSGVNEDPVCGSGNGAIAGFRLRAGQIAAGDNYVARQGRTTGRDGSVTVRIASNGSVSVGGSCITTVRGMLQI